MSASFARLGSRVVLFALCAVLCAVLWSGLARAERTLENPTSYQDPKTGLTVVMGEVVLTGGWYLPVQPTPGAALAEVALGKVEFVKEGDAEEPDYMKDPEAYWAAKRRYQIGGLLRDPSAASITLTLYRPKDKAEETVVLNLAEAKKHPGTEEIFLQWAQQRQGRWGWLNNPQISPTPNMLAYAWQKRSEKLYGTKFYDMRHTQRRWVEDGDAPLELGSLALFGGQLAISETLQTQLLSSGTTQGTGKRVALKDLPGLTVRSHPYERMARSLPVPAASLADYVPADRLMVLLSAPKRLAGLFDLDSGVLARLGAFAGNGFVDYELLERTTARFGVTPKQVKGWLSSGLVVEAAVFTPDVFFLDSTDMTLVIRPDPTVMRMLDLGLAAKGVTTLPLADGTSFYASVADGLLVVSTNRHELDSALALVKKKGAGSLGRSDEFRVMAHELPLQTGAGVYVYFSDPFIRRLTGPEVKINPLRRAFARAQMQNLTAAAALYRLDQGKDGTLKELQERGYLEEGEAPAAEYALEANAVVRSATWGTLASLKTLLDTPVTTVSEAEAEAYREYLIRYENFWREFFDPIAVRLDLAEDGTFSLETFILPLIDNSIYNEVKQAICTRTPDAMALPVSATPPVMSMALQSPPIDLEDLSYSMRSLQMQIGALLKGLDTTAVFSIQDDSPVLQTAYPGSLLGDGGLGSMGFGGEEMLAVPVLSAIFSRPVDLAIAIKDEEKVRNALQNLSFGNYEFINTSTVRYDSDGTQIIALTVMGMIRMEVSLRIEEGWLHISNHPWSAVPIVGSRPVPPNQITIDLTSSAVKKGLPQALSLMQSVYRNAVYASAAELAPWMQAFGTDAAGAAVLQKKALGRSTPLPREVTLDTTYALEVKPYGTWQRQVVPANGGQTSGLPSMPDARLWMRFEGSGLRSRIEFGEAPAP